MFNYLIKYPLSRNMTRYGVNSGKVLFKSGHPVHGQVRDMSKGYGIQSFLTNGITLFRYAAFAF